VDPFHVGDEGLQHRAIVASRRSRTRSCYDAGWTIPGQGHWQPATGASSGWTVIPIWGYHVFSEEHVILGGVVLDIDYKNIGIARRDAVVEFEGIEVKTWLAEVTNGHVGPLAAQPLMTSAIKNFVAHQEGLNAIAIKNRGFITQLPAREYRSVTEVRHAD
jgi:hypothetical protein